MTSPIKSISKDLFTRTGRLSKWGNVALWTAAGILVADFLLGGYKQQIPHWNTALVVQALLLAAYSFLILGSSIVMAKARRVKINDVVDNAFGTDIGSGHSEGYFDNDEIKRGTLRLLYNTAESCFFTCREMKNMTTSVCVKAFIPLTILVLGLVLNRAEVIMAIFRLSAVMVIMTQVVRFITTLSQLEALLERMLTTLKHKITSVAQFNAESINYTLEYETLMVWYGVKIPDKVYLALNESLTAEWEEKKKAFIAK